MPDNAPRPAHIGTKMVRDYKITIYVGNGHKSLFACPRCGREVYQHLNFLGGREVWCLGGKIEKRKPSRAVVDEG